MIDLMYGLSSLRSPATSSSINMSHITRHQLSSIQSIISKRHSGETINTLGYSSHVNLYADLKLNLFLYYLCFGPLTGLLPNPSYFSVSHSSEVSYVRGADQLHCLSVGSRSAQKA